MVSAGGIETLPILSLPFKSKLALITNDDKIIICENQNITIF